MSKTIILLAILILCTTNGVFAQITANPPAFSINCPKETAESDIPVLLTVTSEKEIGDEASFDWSVSDGLISAGHGTKSIEIIAGDAESITATVEINSDTFMTVTASCTFEVRQKPDPILTYEFNHVSDSNTKLMFDSFLIELKSVPGARGYIFIFPSSDKSYGQIEKLLNSRISPRSRIDTRFTFVKGETMTPSYLQFWMVPPGAEAPVPEVTEKDTETEPET